MNTNEKPKDLAIYVNFNCAEPILIWHAKATESFGKQSLRLLRDNIPITNCWFTLEAFQYGGKRRKEITRIGG